MKKFEEKKNQFQRILNKKARNLLEAIFTQDKIKWLNLLLIDDNSPTEE